MEIIRALGHLFKWSIAVFVVMTALMLGWTFAWPEPDVRGLKSADAIMCLGGGMDARGTLANATLKRVERCVQLYEAGLAPVIIFTGGAPRQKPAQARAAKWGVMRCALACPKTP